MSALTEQLLDQLVDLLEHEPPQDAGHHPSMELHERVGAAWAEWDKQVSAYRLLLGTRLVNDAINESRETP